MLPDTQKAFLFVLFQSAPLAEARGDHAACRRYAAPRGFNPLPLPKQGEMSAHPNQHGKRASVSIRSPCRSKGRYARLGAADFVGDEFQSAPLAEARGDQYSYGLRDYSRCGSFNPLPLPKQGEMIPMPPQRNWQPCFNPLPLPKQGEMPAVVTSLFLVVYTG